MTRWWDTRPRDAYDRAMRQRTVRKPWMTEATVILMVVAFLVGLAISEAMACEDCSIGGF